MLRETPPDAIRRPGALAEVAFDRLRADLLARGPLTAGRRLVAGDLATQLGMSRTPVREALDRLGRLGYLEPLDGGGYQRRRYRTRDIRDLHELRVLLEPFAPASGNRVLARVLELLDERLSAIRTDGPDRPRASGA
jgi:DNA-binding GntR family transcriptional regulator